MAGAVRSAQRQSIWISQRAATVPPHCRSAQLRSCRPCARPERTCPSKTTTWGAAGCRRARPKEPQRALPQRDADQKLGRQGQSRAGNATRLGRKYKKLAAARVVVASWRTAKK